MRLIDADALVPQNIAVFCKDGWYYGYSYGTILEAPTIDAAPVKHGRWFDVGSLSCRCSECGCKHDRETRFCPNCGAKMDLEGLDEKQT